jgi:hypothetical protein
MDELSGADIMELAIHRRVSRLDYSRKCAEVLVVQAPYEAVHSSGSKVEIRYVIKMPKVGRPGEKRTKIRRWLVDRCWRGYGRSIARLLFS